jgi:small-conductance mechanosensitive channel
MPSLPLDQVREFVTDPRFIENLITTYAIIVVLVIVSLILRRVVGRGGERLAHWTGLRWLEELGREAGRGVKRLLARLTYALILLIVVAGGVYHFLGRHVRHDIKKWVGQITVEDWTNIGLRAAGVVGLLFASWIAIRLVRGLCQALRTWVAVRLGKAETEDGVKRWFTLLQRFGVVAVLLGVAWAIGELTGLSQWANAAIHFVLRMTTIAVVARLLTLGFRTLSGVLTHNGDRHLKEGRYKNYWARVKLLFPFAERCFEAAVYVQATAMLVRTFEIIADLAGYGRILIECIGIFFVTRVLIELTHVVLHEAFGLYKPDASKNQKGRTLVPLLQSVCQYVLYFGSVLMMLDKWSIPTQPILAGAGILGLAVGLGAQSLVTDVVSGFFILFEAQYLVGDYVKIGDATGIVEEVGIRVTQVRDSEGKVFLIPNGQIKGVVNFSKGYVNAVVDIKVSRGTSVEETFRAMAEAGLRLRQARAEVLADTVVEGIVDLGTSEMTIRAVTKVMPGTHETMQNEYRHMLKTVFDEKNAAEADRSPRLAA